MPQNRCTRWSILNTIGQFPSEAATSFQRRLGHYPNFQNRRTLAGRVYILATRGFENTLRCSFLLAPY